MTKKKPCSQLSRIWAWNKEAFDECAIYEHFDFVSADLLLDSQVRSLVSHNAKKAGKKFKAEKLNHGPNKGRYRFHRLSDPS